MLRRKGIWVWFGGAEEDVGSKVIDSTFQDIYVNYNIYATLNNDQGTGEFKVCLPAMDLGSLFWKPGIRL